MMELSPQPNTWGPLASNLANSLSNMLGFGPQQQWQGLLQALGQSGLLGQINNNQQPGQSLEGLLGQYPEFRESINRPGGIANLWGGTMPQNWSGTGGMPQGQVGGLNLQALGQIQNPQMQEIALKLLGQQSMSPLEQAQIGNLGAETEKTRAEIQGLGRPDIGKMQATATGLRKEFDTLSSPYRLIRDSYSRMTAAAEDPSAAGDIAILYSYMKILDPTSVVRESEYATAENAAGVPDKIRNLWNKALSGEKITYNRQDFLNTAKRLYQAQEKTHQGLIGRYTGLSNRWGISPEDVITEPSNLGAGQNQQITRPANGNEFLQNFYKIYDQSPEMAQRYYELYKGDFR